MDKNSKKILNKLISEGKGTSYVCSFNGSFLGFANIDIHNFSNSIGMDVEDLRAAVRYLHENGYLEYQMLNTSKGKTPCGFHLSHKGLNWRSFRREEILNYIADKWADFFAAAISFVSLIISIAALLQGQ